MQPIEETRQASRWGSQKKRKKTAHIDCLRTMRNGCAAKIGSNAVAMRHTNAMTVSFTLAHHFEIFFHFLCNEHYLRNKSKRLRSKSNYLCIAVNKLRAQLMSLVNVSNNQWNVCTPYMFYLQLVHERRRLQTDVSFTSNDGNPDASSCSFPPVVVRP